MYQINNKTKYFKIIFVLFVFFVFQNSVLAEDTIPTQIPELDEQIDVTMTPKYPAPGDSVTITLDAYGIDLDNSNITWTSDGKNILDEKGQKTLTINADKGGKSTTITVTITPPNSKVVTKTITINPQSVDIIWEANTYTPPFYKGKTLYSQEETIKLVAMPNQIDPKKAIYKWSQDGEVLGNKSGFGMNTLLYTGDVLAQKTDFGVQASDGNGNTSENILSIAPMQTEAYMYENSPLYGILFNKDVSSLFDIGANPEGTISVYPYFFGVQDRNDKKLEYTWSINGNPIDVPTTQNDMTLRNTNNLAGKSRVGVTVTNGVTTPQTAGQSTLVNFAQNSNQTPF